MTLTAQQEAEREQQFPDVFLKEIELLLLQHNATPATQSWNRAVLYLKNRAEGFNFTFDFHNAYHAFAAWLFAICFALGVAKSERVLIAFAMAVGGLIVFLFPYRAEKRRTAMNYRALVNILEYQKTITTLPLNETIREVAVSKPVILNPDCELSLAAQPVETVGSGDRAAFRHIRGA